MTLQRNNIKQTTLSAPSYTAVPNVHKSKKTYIFSHSLAVHHQKNQDDELVASQSNHLPGQHLAQHSGCAAVWENQEHNKSKSSEWTTAAVQARSDQNNLNHSQGWLWGKEYANRMGMYYISSDNLPVSKHFHLPKPDIIFSLETSIYRLAVTYTSNTRTSNQRISKISWMWLEISRI